MSYEKAAAQCQADGGDLFKVDTKLKFEILTEYLGRLYSKHEDNRTVFKASSLYHVKVLIKCI